MEIKFEGKKALVTGAGKGIGRMTTLKLVEAGAEVIAVSRTLSDLDSLKKMNPEKIQTICLDIGNWELTRRVLAEIGPVDLLVNNAGILEDNGFGQICESEVNKTLNINLKSVINITQMIANGMKSSGKGGSIVNVSSIAGQFVVPNFGVYGASKAAVDHLTKSMAVEFGPHKIRVNSVSPTAARTSMGERFRMFDDDNEHAKALAARSPLRRFAEPEEVVGPILFLLSEYASMINGVILPIDGGLAVCYS